MLISYAHIFCPHISQTIIGMWMASQGLDPSVVVAEGVDGKLLLDLSAEDMKSDLGLSGLQAKKVLKNIEYSQSLNSAEPAAEPEGEEPAVVEEEEEIIEERAVRKVRVCIVSLWIYVCVCSIRSLDDLKTLSKLCVLYLIAFATCMYLY